MKQLVRSSLFAAAFGLSATAAWADVKLPAIFSDHMVLQRNTATVPVWGWADPGEEVTVTIAGKSEKTKAGADGRWQVTFSQLKADATAHVLAVKGKNTVTVQDVLIGEVWLASGQSNMAFTVDRGLRPKEEAAAAEFPQLRMFTVARAAIRVPQSDVKGTWEVCRPETAGKFSAVAYFFGRELHQKLGVPVGLINSSVGGTDIAAWTSEDIQRPVPELSQAMAMWAEREKAYDPEKAKEAHAKARAAWAERSKKAKAEGKPAPTAPRQQQDPKVDPNRHANLYNGMIAPLIPYTIRGAIWYQGEHNCGTWESGMLYRKQLELLVKDWRARRGYDLPFAWVQLPGFNNTGPGRAVIREAMLLGLKMKDTGMAVTLDVGDANDNHPKNKQEVGRRLSLWALNTVYGKKNVVYLGPAPAGYKVKGSEITVELKHADGGLVAKGGELKGFMIAGADQQWKPAQARIEGNTVVVSGAEVSKPVAVRYAWAPSPECNLFNGAGLPATPFRTDEWNK